MAVWKTFVAVVTDIRWSRVELLDMLQEVFLLCKDLLADGADMFPFAEVKLIVTIKRFLALKLISIQRTKLNVIHINQLSIF